MSFLIGISMYNIKLLIDEFEAMAPHLHRVLNGLMSGKLQAYESRKIEARSSVTICSIQRK